MTLNEIRSYINALLNKDEFGGELNIPQFNHALNDYNIEFYKNKVESLYAAEISGVIDFDMVFSTKVLRPFIMLADVPVVNTINLASDLTNYAYLLKMRTTSAYVGSIKPIDVVTHSELINRMTNILATSLVDKPVAVFEANNILRFYPTNITSVTIAYLKIPATPIFDYYIDANDNIVYLAAGAPNRVLGANEVGSAGQTAGQTVTSKTVELEYTVDFHPEFVNGLLGKLGIPSRDQVILQTSMVNEQKAEAK